MGRVMALGMEAQSLRKSPRLDKHFAAELEELRADVDQMKTVSEWVLIIN